MSAFHHAVAGGIHVLSALTLLITFALKDGAISQFNRDMTRKDSVWYYFCYDHPEGVYDCPTDERSFYLADTGKPIGSIPVVWLAFTYTIVSGCGHIAVALLVWAGRMTTPSPLETLIRTIDYTISAPTMLAVVNVLFAAPTLWGVVGGPIVVGVTIFATGLTECWRDWEDLNPVASRPPRGGIVASPVQRWSPQWRAAIFTWSPVVLALVYVGAWIPTFLSVDRAINPTAAGPNVGAAPPFLRTVIAIVFLVFSSFGVVYFLHQFAYRTPARGVAQLKARQTRRNTAYLTLSMAAKVTLHAFIMIALINQHEMLQAKKDETQPPAQPAPSTLWGVASAVIAGSILINVLIVYKCFAANGK